MSGRGIIRTIIEVTAVLSVLTAAVSCSDSRGKRGELSLVDSLGRYWGELIHRGAFEDIRSSAGQYYEQARAAGDRELQVRAGIYLGQAWTDVPDSMVRYFNEILPLVKEQDNKAYLMVIYNGFAIYSTNTLLDYNAAIHWYQQALETAYAMDDRLNYCALLCNASDVYYQKRDTSGLSYALEACEIADDLDNDYLKFFSALSAARMYNVCGEYGLSLEYLEEAGQYESSSYYMESLYAQNSLALGDTALAESYYMRIFSHDEPFPSASILEAYMNFGRLLCATGRYSAAESYFTKGIVESEKVRNRRALASMYEGLSEVYSRDGCNALSQEYSLKASMMRDTIETVENEREFGTLRLQYQDAISRIDAQKRDFEIREIRLTLIFTAVTFVIVMTSVLLYFRKKREGYMKLVRQYEERRAAVKRLEADNARLKAQYRDVMEFQRKSAEDNAVGAEKEKARNEALFLRLEELMTGQQIWRDKDISLDSVAQMLGTNTKYVSKCLTDYAGTSFYTYINKYRINEAIRILAVPGDSTPMKAIADMIGYNSLTSFYRVFQKETGVPPRYYREELRAAGAVSQ